MGPHPTLSVGLVQGRNLLTDCGSAPVVLTATRAPLTGGGTARYPCQVGMLFVFAGDDQARGRAVDVPFAEHLRIMEAVRASSHDQFPFICRLHEFFRDVEFEVHEVPSLIAELTSLSSVVRGALLEQLSGLCRAALEEGVGVDVIAD